MNERRRCVLTIALLVAWLASSLGVHGLHDCRSHGSARSQASATGRVAPDAGTTHVCAFHPRPVRSSVQRSFSDLDATRDVNRSEKSAGSSVQVVGLQTHGELSGASVCLACSYLALAALRSAEDAPASRESVVERAVFFSRSEASEPLAGAVVPRGPPATL